MRTGVTLTSQPDEEREFMTDTTTPLRTARETLGSSPLVAIEDEPAPQLIVDPPLPGPLAAGKVFIQYRAENLRVVPVFGQGALDVSPRIGHVHITVDDAQWHFPGPHRVLFELANPVHQVITSQTVEFTVPG
jgi:hypothetical protein